MLVFLAHSKPLLRGGLCTGCPPQFPPTQPRVSRHPAGSSPAWVPEKLARVCTFPSKEDAAHFATPSRGSKTLPRSRRERRIRGLYKLRNPPNPIRASCCVQVRFRGSPENANNPLKIGGNSARDITSLHSLSTLTQKQSTNHETLPNPTAPHLRRPGCAGLGPSPFKG